MGAPFDGQRWAAIAEEAERSRQAISMEMTDLISTRDVQTSFKLGPLARPAINWGSAERVREVLQERSIDLPDTEEDTLMRTWAVTS